MSTKLRILCLGDSLTDLLNLQKTCTWIQEVNESWIQFQKICGQWKKFGLTEISFAIQTFVHCFVGVKLEARARSYRAPSPALKAVNNGFGVTN